MAANRETLERRIESKGKLIKLLEDQQVQAMFESGPGSERKRENIARRIAAAKRQIVEMEAEIRELERIAWKPSRQEIGQVEEEDWSSWLK